MISYLLDPANLAFTIALGLMLFIGALEVFSFLMGAGLSEFLDNLLPDVDLDLDMDVDVDVDADLDVDVDADMDTGGVDASNLSGFLRALGWLGLGKVPVLILVVIFLCVFGILGLVMQFVVLRLTGGHFMLPGWLAWLPVLAVTLPVVRWCARTFGRFVPKEETQAVSSSALVGRVAVVVTGTARLASPAQAKCRDRHGQTHYVMVEPDEEEEEFATGTTVVLVKQMGAVYQAIRNPSDALVD